MAATDKPYRNQKTLDIVFAVSCVLLLVTTFWMFAQDYNRDWKKVQRKFRDVEAAVTQRAMLENLPDSKVVNALREDVEKKRQAVEEKREELAGPLSELQAEYDRLYARFQAYKANYDAIQSYYNIAIEHRDTANSEGERGEYQKTADERKAELAELQKNIQDTQALMDKNLEAKQELMNKKESEADRSFNERQQDLADAQKDLKEVVDQFDLFAKASAQKNWQTDETIRSLPILDAFESPVKIQQATLPNLTIDYAFKQVPRYDRCQTCHLGIDRGIFDAETLATLANAHEEMQKKLETAGNILKEREEGGENLGFDRRNLPGYQPLSWVPWSLLLLGLGLVLIPTAAAFVVPISQTVWNICLAAMTALVLLSFVFFFIWGPENWAEYQYQVAAVELDRTEVKQYSAHPRLDLFVDSNSPHPVEKFGCTICHSGQGSATDFTLASHTPDNAHQEHFWKEHFNWESNHYWDYKMLPNRFTESSCLKCHHEVTDLVTHGSKEEAPKLLQGYNLVRENGCFGCHEISGMKGDRRVGPDLRLEPSPPLAWLTATEKEAAEANKQTPVGTFRKVGPSLRRLSEKTNEKWTRQWIHSPRDFREDTRMPHFFNLTNNHPDVLPEGQKLFPAAEIYGMSHYLLTEAKNHLEAQDFYRVALEKQLAEKQALLDPASESHADVNAKLQKDLQTLTLSVRDLALLSNPTRADTINAARTELDRQYDRIFELYFKIADLDKLQAGGVEVVDDPDALRGQLQKPWSDIQTETKRLLDASKPTPLATQLVDADGNPVSLPEAGDDMKRANGQRLFTERGCLACHSHDSAPVKSDANFGPNLSRMAAKIVPEGGDAEARRRWMVQWIVNPNVHHPRTRMPVTYLTVAEAADVADWLLSVGDQEYTENDPEKPTRETLLNLARLYLSRAPGMTSGQVDAYLPTEGEIKGIDEARLRNMKPDADEQKLGGLDALEEDQVDSRLLWYIGKKSINRQGCFGCHDIPGFENAKPIGTALNDWGLKDPARLAFENINAYLDKHYHIVPARKTTEELEAEIKAKDRPARLKELEAKFAEDGFLPLVERRELDALKANSKLTADEQKELDELRELKDKHPWEYKDGKEPYEEYFAEALRHHNREGFLHQKLLAPRSYDYNRDRTWDDRLRMPQFRFARTRRQADESEEAYQVRRSRDEAEAREAVMTFILGLTGEQVPPQYVNQPGPDKLAEAHGRKVLDQFNCAGCHQIRAGVFEVKNSDQNLKFLQGAHNSAAAGRGSDFMFPGHNAWVAPPQPPDRLRLYGTQARIENFTVEEEEEPVFVVRLTEAMRFTNKAGLTQELLAKDSAWLYPPDVVSRADPYGGDFADLLTESEYLNRLPWSADTDPKARDRLPPPLIRQGERVQPNWLYQFLLNPYPIRPHVALRMPRFNMSGDEARAIVNYFAAADRLTNPGAGDLRSYVDLPQRDREFWRRKTEAYVKSLGEEKVKARLEALQPTFEIVLEEQASEAQRKVAVAEAALKAAKPDQKQQAQTTLDALKEELKQAEERLQNKDVAQMKKRWLEEDAYAVDGYRLLTTHINGVCLTCHTLGNVGAKQGPPLDQVYNRLRPEWTVRWIAHPQRLFGYDTVMPQNFPANDPQSKDLFDAPPLEQIMAIRDILMNYPEVANMPVNRYLKVAPAGGNK